MPHNDSGEAKIASRGRWETLQRKTPRDRLTLKNARYVAQMLSPSYESIGPSAFDLLLLPERLT